MYNYLHCGFFDLIMHQATACVTVCMGETFQGVLLISLGAAAEHVAHAHKGATPRPTLTSVSATPS